MRIGLSTAMRLLRSVVFGEGQPLCDLAVDPIDGTQLLIEESPGAVSVIMVVLDKRHLVGPARPNT